MQAVARSIVAAVVASPLIAVAVIGAAATSSAAPGPCVNQPSQQNNPPPANSESPANNPPSANNPPPSQNPVNPPASYEPSTTDPGPTIVTVSCNHWPEATPPQVTQPPSTFTVQTNTGTAPSLPSRVPQTPKQPTQPPVNVPQPTVTPLPLTIAPVPPPPEVVIPTPAAPPPQAPNIALTSSVDTGTQSLAIILVFLVIGSWFYANRIVSQWTLGKKAHASSSA